MAKNYLALTLVALIAFGAYGYVRYLAWSRAHQAIVEGQSTIEQLRSSNAQIESSYRDLKKSFDTDFQTLSDGMEAVYPSEESYTSLTRLLEGYVQQQNKSFDPMDLTDVRYGRPRIDAKAEYAVLPVTLTLSTTRSNLEKFLSYIKNSGSLDSGVRLMDIRSISIGFPNEQTTVMPNTGAATSANVLNVSVSLNAYYQKPVMNTTTPKKS